MTELNGPRGPTHDELLQAYFLLNDSRNIHPTAKQEQGLRCFTEALLWAAEETDRNPSISPWFRFWFVECVKFLCQNQLNSESFLLPFVNALAIFFFQPPLGIPFDGDMACRNMMRAWARLDDIEFMELFSPIIGRRIKKMNILQYSLVFVATLQKYNPENPLIAKFQGEIGKYELWDILEWAVNKELTPEEEAEEFKKSWAMRGADFCNRVSKIGIAVLALYPLSIAIHAVTGHELPIVSTIQSYSIKSGGAIIASGLAGMSFLLVAFGVALMVQGFFNRANGL